MTSTDSRPQTAGVAPGAWASLAVVSGGLFLAVMSTTVVSVALPAIGQAVQANATDLEWIVDAYVLVYATLLVAGGTLGDRYGRKGLFLLGIGLFAGGSLLTGLASSVPVLLLGRVLQGIGPALLVPGSLTIIRATFEDERRRAVAIGLWSTSSGLAMALGPVLGGVLVHAAGWRWVFLFNVPLALILLLVAAKSVPKLPRVPAEAGFDWWGAVLSTVSIALLVLGVIEGQAAGWDAPLVIGCFVAGVAALAGFVLWERRKREPLVDVKLFAYRGFAVANAAAFVVFFGFIGVIVYLSAFFQQVRGESPVSAGLNIAILGVSLAIAAALTGKLVERVGERGPMVFGLLLSGAATLALLVLDNKSGIGEMWWQFVALGVGIGLCGTVTTTIAMSAVAAERAGMASAIVNALRQIGQVFGVAVLGALVYAGLSHGGAGGKLPPEQGIQFVDGLHNALWVAGLALIAVAIAAVALLPRSDHSGQQKGAPK
ncbi:DHA2 family methylenomycin A resistance protein-like MFS transporter [Kibdelosporangium banguiense]|uniref:DHA2 family methylenomycin A resistance protein-like MFS transporter n=1 Tax=Kibdelosporangium banguiense TaxID=1365924 RepID=A0ABS4TKR5_9PSEU|nr:MFS transporter [Kibdelosporangium banguiense]MBP2325009.1 DHA2 family methylenomycin A resistance protein-like MFS transporter [Kibdelosporangium banguiense]